MSEEPLGVSRGSRVEDLWALEAETMARIFRIGSCTMATIDRKGRTRVRMVNVVWENMIAYLVTWANSLKTKHVIAHPYLSLCYWDPTHQQVYADCSVEVIRDLDEKRRIFKLTQETPPPVGYDPSPYFRDGPNDPNCVVLKMKPWRMELFELANLEDGANQFWMDDSANRSARLD